MDQWRISVGTFIISSTKASHQGVPSTLPSTFHRLYEYIKLMLLPIKISVGIIQLFFLAFFINIFFLSFLCFCISFEAIIFLIDPRFNNRLDPTLTSVFLGPFIFVIHARNIFSIGKSGLFFRSYSTNILSYFKRFILFSKAKSCALYTNFHFTFVVVRILLLISGSVETNPGPKQIFSSFKFAFWNLDSLPARDYARIPLIESFQASHNVDVFGVCESMLSDNVSNGDIFVNGFSPDPFRADKPHGIRNGGVCLYFKENLPIRERKDLEFPPEKLWLKSN